MNTLNCSGCGLQYIHTYLISQRGICGICRHKLEGKRLMRLREMYAIASQRVYTEEETAKLMALDCPCGALEEKEYNG